MKFDTKHSCFAYLIHHGTWAGVIVAHELMYTIFWLWKMETRECNVNMNTDITWTTVDQCDSCHYLLWNGVFSSNFSGVIQYVFVYDRNKKKTQVHIFLSLNIKRTQEKKVITFIQVYRCAYAHRPFSPYKSHFTKFFFIDPQVNLLFK